MMAMNFKITKFVANQEKIVSLIEKQDHRVNLEKFDSIMSAEFVDHFDSNFPMDLMDDINKLEHLLKNHYYYKLIVKIKKFSFIFS